MRDDKTSKLLEEIQKELNNGFSEVVLDHALNPRNAGGIDDDDAFAAFTGPCGDTMMIWLKVRDNRIFIARFWTDGCGTAIACGSMVTEMARGRSLDEAMRIEQANVLEELGGLPKESEHCALLAATTLKRSIDDFILRKNQSAGGTAGGEQAVDDREAAT